MIIKSGHANIADISELKFSNSNADAKIKDVNSDDKNKDNNIKDSDIKSGGNNRKDNDNNKPLTMPRTPVLKITNALKATDIGAKPAQSGKSVLIEYLGGRKHYIFILCAVYVAGAIVGALLINGLEQTEAAALCAIVDDYFLSASSADMLSRIFGNIAVNLVFVLGLYLCGVTIFSPIACIAVGLYKGLSIGFITGVYIIGGGTGFHAAAASLGLILNLFVMAFFVLICAEAMSFSSFLFKSDESFKSNMSFKNIRVYSSRFMLLTVLTALATVVQTIVIPLVYSWAR